MYAKGVETLGCDFFRDPHNVDAVNAFPTIFPFHRLIWMRRWLKYPTYSSSW